MRHWARLGLGLLGLAVVACGGAPEPSSETRLVNVGLVPMNSCQDGEEAARRALMNFMNRRIDENLASWLTTAGRDCSQQDDAVYGAGPTANPTNTPNSSTTNNQVPGVEEADFVKNDGDLVYIAQNGALSIVDAWPVETMHQLSRTPLEGEPKKLLLLEDHVVVYSSMGDPPPSYGPYGVQPECTYGYNCDFVGDGRETRVSVFDVTNPNAPKLVRTLDLSGSLIAARGVGKTTHSVVYDQANGILGKLEFYPLDLDECGNFAPVRGTIAFEALRAKNAEVISKADVYQILPSIVDRLEGQADAKDLMANCEGLYDSPLGDGVGFLTVLSFDPASSDPIVKSSIASRPGAVYANAEALYVGVRQYAHESANWFFSGQGSASVTALHKFALNSQTAGSKYVASGLVEGTVLNQFAMDEHEGHLRVATSTRRAGFGNGENIVTVVAQQDNALSVVGKVDGIAKGEDIRSARFDGDVGFVVTFRQMDPLHIIDLSNPASPRVTGELEIPGFSTYIHLMDPGHLLTIGTSGNGGNNVALQMFDVSNRANPTLMYKQPLNSFASSEALKNHLAFNYFPEKGMLALPFAKCGSYTNTPGANGLAVFDISTDSGISPHGELLVPIGTSNPTGYDSGCYGWWANSSSRVRRSIFLGDYILAISADRLTGSHLDAVDVSVASVPLSK